MWIIIALVFHLLSVVGHMDLSMYRKSYQHGDTFQIWKVFINTQFMCELVFTPFSIMSEILASQNIDVGKNH